MPAPNVNINMPADKAAGHYADFAMVWHTPETFVIDFLATTKPVAPDPDNAGGVLIDSEVTSRVRIPAAQVWELMKALNEQYSAWEAETGQTPTEPNPPTS